MSLAIKSARYGAMGDPGLFGDIWGGIKKVGKSVLGVASQSGIPGISQIGKVGSALLGGAGGTVALPRSLNGGAPRGLALPQNGGKISIRLPDPRQIKGLLPTGPGTTRLGPANGVNGGMRPGPSPTGRAREVIFAENGACPQGYHPNKSGYWVDSPLGTPSYVSPGERCVRNRRRNVGNMRALDRSISRVKGAKRMAKKLGQITVREKCPS